MPLDYGMQTASPARIRRAAWLFLVAAAMVLVYSIGFGGVVCCVSVSAPIRGGTPEIHWDALGFSWERATAPLSDDFPYFTMGAALAVFFYSAWGLWRGHTNASGFAFTTACLLIGPMLLLGLLPVGHFAYNVWQIYSGTPTVAVWMIVPTCWVLVLGIDALLAVWGLWPAVWPNVRAKFEAKRSSAKAIRDKQLGEGIES